MHIWVLSHCAHSHLYQATYHRISNHSGLTTADLRQKPSHVKAEVVARKQVETLLAMLWPVLIAVILKAINSQKTRALEVSVSWMWVGEYQNWRVCLEKLIEHVLSAWLKLFCWVFRWLVAAVPGSLCRGMEENDPLEGSSGHNIIYHPALPQNVSKGFLHYILHFIYFRNI